MSERGCNTGLGSPSKGSDSETGNELADLQHKNDKQFDIYNLTCQETAPPGAVNLNRPRRGSHRLIYINRPPKCSMNMGAICGFPVIFCSVLPGHLTILRFAPAWHVQASPVSYKTDFEQCELKCPTEGKRHVLFSERRENMCFLNIFEGPDL